MRRILLVILSLLLIPAMYSQRDPLDRHVAPQFRRDTVAIIRLQAALSALGGNAWHAIHNAHAEGTVVEARAGSTQVPLICEDDWSGNKLRIRREITGTNSSIVRLSNPDEGSFIQYPGKVKRISSRANVALLPMHLPGAVLTMILQGSDYSISFAPANTGNAGYTVVRIVRFEKGRADQLSQQDWWFVGSNSLPERVVVQSPDLNGSDSSDPETYRYLRFETIGEVLAATDFEVSGPSGSSRIRFATVTFNNALPAGRFSPAR